MDIFDLLKFFGGISLFLFGMSIMGKTLEKTAGGKLKKIINKMTTNKFIGFLTGLGVTAIIQSSSATTVMVVGFVNSKLMNLGQAINVIMGANVGTTITAWILSLTGISSTNVFVRFFKPSSFSPILALIGVILYMFFKTDKKKNSGIILLGFATLMFGMETMSDSVSALKNVVWFKNLFLVFENNPLLGVLTGAFVTAIIQSSSASVGILQAFAITGQISFSAATAIILGQNIGTCVTALISSVGANRNAKKASLVHLFFNLIGTMVMLLIYILIKAIFNPTILSQPATLLGIAIVHTSFNVLCVVLLFPFSKLLEKLVCKILPNKKEETFTEIDDRLLNTPSLALEQAKEKVVEMGKQVEIALFNSLSSFNNEPKYEAVNIAEDKTDQYEDLIGTYLVKLSTKELDDENSEKVCMYLKIIGDLERIADHSLNIAKTNNEMIQKDVVFSASAKKEIDVCFSAIKEIWNLTYLSLAKNSFIESKKIEPLEQVIDVLVKMVKNNHITRIQNEECSLCKGFVLSDLLSNIERISDHCSNIAGYIIDNHQNNLNSHQNIHHYRHNEEFRELYDKYMTEYRINE